LRASLVERGRRLAATPLLASTIDDHFHGLTGEDVPQVCVPRRFLAPHYDQQTSHTPSPVDHQPETVNRVLCPWPIKRLRGLSGNWAKHAKRSRNLPQRRRSRPGVRQNPGLRVFPRPAWWFPRIPQGGVGRLPWGHGGADFRREVSVMNDRDARMLIIDDDVAALDELADYFTSQGFRVDTAVRADDARTSLAE